MKQLEKLIIHTLRLKKKTTTKNALYFRGETLEKKLPIFR